MAVASCPEPALSQARIGMCHELTPPEWTQDLAGLVLSSGPSHRHSFEDAHELGNEEEDGEMRGANNE